MGWCLAAVVVESLQICSCFIVLEFLRASKFYMVNEMITKIHWWISNQQRPKYPLWTHTAHLWGVQGQIFLRSYFPFAVSFLGEWIVVNPEPFDGHRFSSSSSSSSSLFFIFCLFFVSMVWVWKSFRFFFSLSFQGNQKTVKMPEQIQLQIPHKDKRNCCVKCNWMWFRFGRKWISPLLRMLHFVLKKEENVKEAEKDEEKKVVLTKARKKVFAWLFQWG